MLLFCSSAYAITSDTIQGTWIVPDEDAHVTIYTRNGLFYGKLSWLKEPDERDTKNPDPKCRNDVLLGKEILKEFSFKKDKWAGGTVYDPNSGNTYQGKIWIRDDDRNTLYLKGFVGIPIFGRSEKWKRIESAEISTN